MPTQRKHFVDFFSPGTFVSEQSRREVKALDTREAVEIANGIQERHAAKPYGFQFVTCIVSDAIPDGEGGKLEVAPKEVERSGTHYLGGKLLMYDEMPETKDTHILRSNMRGNNMPICIENCNSWRFTGEFKEKDCIVDADGSVTRRGKDADLMNYRTLMTAAFQSERERMREEWEAKHGKINA